MYTEVIGIWAQTKESGKGCEGCVKYGGGEGTPEGQMRQEWEKVRVESVVLRRVQWEGEMKDRSVREGVL